MRVVLAVTGSIAAYKSALITRLLVKSGAEVQVLMTPSAADFITPLTLATLSKRPVLSDVHSEQGWNNHVELGLWADVLLVAPATANTLAKLANGICDNIVGAVYLSARCPVCIAPAMDVDMWQHPATRENIRKLESHGALIIPVGHGELASGLVGDGRMAEPEAILAFLQERLILQGNKALEGKKVLVTAGPTFEPLDPVRFLGNHSTGKMGIAIAEKMCAEGADVTLILGPTDLQPAPCSRMHVVSVTTAQEMFEACSAVFPQTDIAVLAAAVADYRPKVFSEVKIKKKDDDMSIELSKTVDIAASLGKIKREGQILVGFALETNNEEQNALAKMEKKKLDFIVLNSLKDPGAGFGHDTNKITTLHHNGNRQEFPLKDKKSVAADIVDEIIRYSANPNRL